MKALDGKAVERRWEKATTFNIVEDEDSKSTSEE